MSTQPYSRADRNRIRAAFRAGKNGLIVVAIDETAGSITVESEAYLCARLRAGRPMRRPARIAPPRRLDTIPLHDGAVRNFHAPRMFIRDEHGNVAVVDLAEIP